MQSHFHALVRKPSVFISRVAFDDDLNNLVDEMLPVWLDITCQVHSQCGGLVGAPTRESMATCVLS